MENVVAVAALLSWTNFTWFNQPTTWSTNETSISVHTDPDTDFWSKTYYGFERDTGHFYYRSLPGNRPFTATVNVRGKYQALYDQGGLMLRIDKNNWIKCGVEYVEGQHHASVVVTVNGWSDWNVVAIQPPDVLKLRVKRENETVHIDFAEGERGSFQMIRLAYFPVLDRSQVIMVGVMCASPTKDALGFDITFDNMSIVEGSDQGGNGAGTLHLTSSLLLIVLVLAFNHLIQ